MLQKSEKERFFDDKSYTVMVMFKDLVWEIEGKKYKWDWVDIEVPFGTLITLKCILQITWKLGSGTWGK